MENSISLASRNTIDNRDPSSNDATWLIGDLSLEEYQDVIHLSSKHPPHPLTLTEEYPDLGVLSPTLNPSRIEVWSSSIEALVHGIFVIILLFLLELPFTKSLLSKGCSVVIGDLALRFEDEKLLAEHPFSKGASKPEVIFQRTDVTSWPQLSALFNKALDSYSQHPPKTATNPDTPSRDSANAEPGVYKQIEVNLTHPIPLSQLSIGYWTKNKLSGTLAHVSSIAGHSTGIGTPIYAWLLWTEDPEKKHLTGGKTDIPMEPETIAGGMLELCENPEYGNGTVFECINDHPRVVLLYNADLPPPRANDMPALAEAWGKITEKLKTDGLNV
ncbi:hypothetical protein F5Y16DRAFT_424498 [Xylariaceae sp. FL0255]|nr:hypothetical protein F5Y16DRAFT_424498 [Xylariaceae sp. FL0255]